MEQIGIYPSKLFLVNSNLEMYHVSQKSLIICMDRSAESLKLPKKRRRSSSEEDF